MTSLSVKSGAVSDVRFGCIPEYVYASEIKTSPSDKINFFACTSKS